ncbi:MAG: Hsp70 family protein [Reyranella sp.]|nr:Hsp70 family protein [Reyranella sp.]
MIACGLDFGTSNSAIGVARDGGAELAPVEAGNILLPSAVFFDFENEGRVLFGNEAIGAYVERTEGRLMRALKSILGSPLIDEQTSVGGRKVSLAAVVGIFVRHLKRQAETFAGQEIVTAVLGRPVRFDDDDRADARAQEVLEGIAREAGFRNISFVYEPVAAAHDYEQTATREELVLIADIGGGTSDFSVVRLGPERRERADRGADVLANAGIRLGGTDLDTSLSLEAVMPRLGLGSRLVYKDLPMPLAAYRELATWATINFAYTRKNERELAELALLAREPEKVGRLLALVRRRLGHRLALAVEEAKIALSVEERATLPLGFLEGGLDVVATRPAFDRAIAAGMARLHRTAAECIAAAGVKADAIETIFLTGGTSRVPAVREAISRAAPAARLTGGSDLLSVALGLTRIAAL